MKKILFFLALTAGCLSAGVTTAKLVDFYAERGQQLPSVAARAVSALQCRLVKAPAEYTGTQIQNNQLEQCLRSEQGEGLLSGTVTKPYTFSPNTVIRSSEINSNFDTLYTLVNGQLENVNIKSGAAIDASKISGTAIISNPSAAQTISATTTFTGTVLVSTTNGFFAVPRVTTAQRAALYGLENGAMVYDTTLGQMMAYEGGSWAGLSASAVSAVASLTGKGVVELSTGLEAASSTPAGSGNTDAPLVLHTGIATTTPYTTGNFVPITKANGKLDTSFFDLTANFLWSGTHRFTGPTFVSSSLNVSSTPSMPFLVDTITSATTTASSTFPKLITQQIGSGSTASTTMINPLVVNAPISWTKTLGPANIVAGQFSKVLNDTTDITVTHNMGIAPNFIRISCMHANASGISVSEGTYTSAGQGSTYSSIDNGNGTSSVMGQDGNIIHLENSANSLLVASISAVGVNTFTLSVSSNQNAGNTRRCQYSAHL